MKHYIISSLLFFFALGHSRAQLLHTPTFLDNTLVNSPASLGALQQESIQISMLSYMSTFSPGRISFGFPTTAPQPSLNQILPRSDEHLSAFNIKRFNSISYHYTQDLSNKYKVTIGLQVQTTNLRTIRVSSPNTYGITTNLHIPLGTSNRQEQYFSCGIQMNLIHQKPSRTITGYAFNNLIDSPSIDYDSFHKQFSKTGFQYTVNLGWLKYKPKKSLIAIGVSGGFVESKIANTFGASTTGSFSFDSVLGYSGHIYFNGQFTSGGRFMIDLSVLSGTENGIGSLSLGFKLIHDKIMRIAANLFADGSFGDGGFIISFESSKYSFNLHLTNSLANMDTFTRDGRTIQIGATYRMSQEGNPTLLNRKY